MKLSGTIILKKGRTQSVERFHPWIFSGAIDRIDGKTEDGDWVKVVDHKGNTLGFGHYQKSTITVRLLSFAQNIPTDDIWLQKLTAAFDQRVASGFISEQTNAFRLIHGEADGLPGLIVDIYNGVAVMQAHDAGMYQDRHEIAKGLQQLMGNHLSAIYLKSQPASGKKTESEYLFGMGVVPHIIAEHGNRFYVDWEEGQKTGFFLDQRENRRLLSDFVKNKTVLNTFCYTGGFSVYAVNGGALRVHSVDASEKAISLTEKNLELNGIDPTHHKCFAADTFDFFASSDEAYDVIILDPPAFAKHRDAKHQAMKGYQRLNAEAMRKVKSGGIIFTFSCSQVVGRQLFYDTIVSAAIQSGREIKVLQHMGHPADHPVSLYHPEGEYLKGLVLYVA